MFGICPISIVSAKRAMPRLTHDQLAKILDDLYALGLIPAPHAPSAAATVGPIR